MVFLIFSRRVQITTALRVMNEGENIQQVREEGKRLVQISSDTEGEISLLIGRMNAMDMQIKAMQEGFNRLQAALQPTLSRQGACNGGAEPAS